MKHLPTILALLACLCAAPHVSCGAPPELGICYKATVVKVVDGDTIDVELRIPVRIRLLDCWCPESRTKDPIEKKLGLRAKATMEDATAGKPPAIVYIPMKDARSLGDVLTLGRVLGHVWIEGFDESLSQMQVRVGNATETKEGLLK